MKKRALLLLTSLVLSLSLFGCGEQEVDDDEEEYEESEKKEKKKKSDEEQKVDDAIDELDQETAGTAEAASEPEKETPVEETPVEETPVKETPVEEEPAKEGPVRGGAFATAVSNEYMAGTWITDKIDATDAFMKGFLSTGGEYAEYFDIDKFELALKIEFREDGTYLMTMDPETMKTALDTISVALKSGMGRYMEDTFRANAEQIGMTYEQLLEQSGATDIDDLLKKSVGMDINELVDSLFVDLSESLDESVKEEGSYRVNDTTVYITISGVEEVCPLDLATNSFVIPDNGNRGDSAFLFPMTFRKN